MTSSISGNYGSYSSYGAAGTRQRPDASKMAEKLFSKLDTKNQGYIDKSDLESAFANIAGSSSSDSSSASVDDILSQLDGDGDGKITKDEMTSGFKQLADELDSQFSQMRMNGFGGRGHGGPEGMGGTPPPRGKRDDGNDAGFTKDELTSQLQAMDSTDSKRAGFISNIVDNFDKADSDGDGKVSRQEARAFNKASKTDGSSGSAADGISASQSSEAQIMHKIMQLMHAYGRNDNDASQSAGAASLLSVAA